MTDENFRLTRRKVLGGMAAMGAGAALGGAGTMAFFSDEETFTNNQLTAGSLDLQVDWEEHYSDASADEVADPTGQGTLDVQVNEPSNPENYVGLPDPESPLVWVHQDDLSAFMDNTSIEAFPDASADDNEGTANDGVQEPFADSEVCGDDSVLGSIGGDNNVLNPDNTFGPDGFHRTLNDDTVETDDQGNITNIKPLVNLDDVKPGDFGELTLSMHLCDNPGYIWLQGGLVEARENGVNEPEADDGDEEGPTDEVATDIENAQVELLDEVQTMLWYDEDGDNVYEPGGETNEVDVVLVLDRSGSMSGDKIDEAKTAAEGLVDALGGGAQIGLVSFADNVSLDQGLTSNPSTVKSAIQGLSTGGSTNIEGGVDAAHEELTGDDVSNITPSGNARSGADKVMVVLSDGTPNVNGDNNDEGDTNFGDADPLDNANDAKSAGIELFTVGFGISEGDDTATLLENMASDPTEDHAFLGDVGELENIFGQISQILVGEEVFFRGSLRELLTVLESQGPNNVAGIPLDGNRATQYEEVTQDNLPADGTADGRDCYVASTTNAIGLAWWLPADHGNEVQTDSVEFDLGFYTEQCRHNDGAGIPQAD